MMKRFLIWLLAICMLASCLGLTGCEWMGSRLEKYTTYSFDYFDTVTTITGYAESQEEFDAVTEGILSELAEYHRLYTIYHRFDGMENLCTVNEVVDGSHRTVKVDPRIIDMLLYAKEMYTLTNGQLNIAMGSVLSIWHDYREEGRNDPASAELPPMDKLVEANEHTDIGCLVIDEKSSTVTITDPRMTLDVGAVAKGYAVEMVARSMEEQGITGYVLNVGGNVRTVGPKGDGEPWTVGVENPDEEGDPYLAYLSLTRHSLVTSGSYQRYYLVDGKRYHHIIDPETLMPAEGFTLVSVVAPHSGMGDALSTALFCMTLEEGMALVNSIPDVEALWLTDSGEMHHSEGIASYFPLPSYTTR